MKTANALPLKASLIALLLGAAPAASTTVRQLAAPAAIPAAAPRPVAPVAAQVMAPAPAPRPAPLVVAPGSLDPGEFVWRPELATAGPVEMVISIPLQVAYVYRGGTLIGVTSVSTGSVGRDTPTGRFPITQKATMAYSYRYNNAPMPFMQRLTTRGIALHAGHNPGYPASHGCIRLPLAMARGLFAVTEIGSNVHVIAHSPTADVALATVRSGELTAIALEGGGMVAGSR